MHQNISFEISISVLTSKINTACNIPLPFPYDPFGYIIALLYTPCYPKKCKLIKRNCVQYMNRIRNRVCLLLFGTGITLKTQCFWKRPQLVTKPHTFFIKVYSNLPRTDFFQSHCFQRNDSLLIHQSSTHSFQISFMLQAFKKYLSRPCYRASPDRSFNLKGNGTHLFSIQALFSLLDWFPYLYM